MFKRFKKWLIKRKKLLIALGLIIVVLLIARSYFSSKSAEKEKATVQKGRVTQELVLSGQIKANEDAKLSFLGAGELGALSVKEGDKVKKGQFLAKLDTTILWASNQMASSDLRLARATLNRVYDQLQGHEKDESFTQIEIRTQAEVSHDKAYYATLIAGKNLSNLFLKAPFDGIVASVVPAFAGVNIFGGNYLLRIINPESYYFEVIADQTEVGEIKAGQSVEIKLDSNDQIIKGEVIFVALAPQEGEAGTTYAVKVRLNKPYESDKIKIGMTGDAKFILSQKSDVLFVSPQFVNSDSEGKYLFVESPKNKVYVETGIEGQESIEVKGSIKEGDVVYD